MKEDVEGVKDSSLMKVISEDKGLQQKTIQSIAILLFLMMFVLDKVLNMITPPISDIWYGISVSVAVFGKYADKLLLKGK